MPVRIGPLRAAALQHRLVDPPPPPMRQPPSLQHHHHHQQHHRLFFHTTPTRRDEIDDKNHYETLNIQTNASPADIKKSFYTLSKTHHPDHNRADPHAPRRFMRISEAYSTLSNAEKRAKYDRDVLRLHHDSSSPSDPNARGGGKGHSYWSSSKNSSTTTGPAGGRPASGLSRRRGPFRGPPPSFYRAGGRGAHGAKRSAGAAGAGSSPGQDNSDSAYTASSYNAGGMGSNPGQQPPFGSHHHHHGGENEAHDHDQYNDDIPHFDRAARAQHTRTHARVDARRRAARQQRYEPPPSSPPFPPPGGGSSSTTTTTTTNPGGGGGDMGDVGKLFAVLGVLGLAGLVPYLFSRASGLATEGKKKGVGKGGKSV